MNPQSVVLPAVAAALLLIFFIAGAVYINQPRPPAAPASPTSPASPAIVETSPAPADAYSPSRVLPTPPSFEGREADAATDRVTVYLRWVAQMEVRRRMALVDLAHFSNNDTGRSLERLNRGEFPPRSSNESGAEGATAAERESLRLMQESVAGMRVRLKELAEEAQTQTAPPELARFHRAYREFVPWAGDVMTTMLQMQVEMAQSAISGDRENARKLMTRFALMQQEAGDQETRTKRLLADLNAELDTVRAHTADLPESLRTLKIETM